MVGPAPDVQCHSLCSTTLRATWPSSFGAGRPRVLDGVGGVSPPGRLWQRWVTFGAIPSRRASRFNATIASAADRCRR